MKPFDLVVFDMDGVLLDSEPLHRIAIGEMMERMGARMPQGGDATGTSSAEMWRRILEYSALSGDPDALETEQYARIFAVMDAQGTRESAGLLPLLDALDAQGIRAAVASSSRRDYVEEMLRRLSLAERFCAVAAGGDTARRKPWPDLYELAVRRAGCTPARSVAIEDAQAGIRAAKAAGLRAIGYRNPTTGEQDLSQADWVVGALRAVHPILLHSIPQSSNAAEMCAK